MRHRFFRHAHALFAREHFGEGFGEHRRRMRGGGRMFDHGDLRFVALRLIADKPSHGYEIIKAIEDRLHGAYSPSPGAVYPTLTLLEELGHVTVSSPDGKRKLYEITPEGSAFLGANRPQVEAIFARMNAAGEGRGGNRAPQILRAVHNMRMALRLRVMRGPLDPQQVEAIAAVLDEAAAKIERI